MLAAVTAFVKVFLSTPSARRATCRSDGLGTSRSISIHALREEGDAAGLQHPAA